MVAKLKEKKPKRRVFRDKDVSNQVFEDLDLKNIVFTGATLRGTQFVNCDLRGMKQANKAGYSDPLLRNKAPDTTGTVFRNCQISFHPHYFTLFRNATFIDCTFSHHGGPEIKDRGILGVQFEEVSFQRCSFTGAHNLAEELKHHASHSSYQTKDTSSFRFTACKLEGCTFSHMLAVVLQFTLSSLQKVNFQHMSVIDGLWDYSMFQLCNWKNLVIRYELKLSDSDFYDCTVLDLNFAKSKHSSPAMLSGTSRSHWKHSSWENVDCSDAKAVPNFSDVRLKNVNLIGRGDVLISPLRWIGGDVTLVNLVLNNEARTTNEVVLRSLQGDNFVLAGRMLRLKLDSPNLSNPDLSGVRARFPSLHCFSRLVNAKVPENPVDLFGSAVPIQSASIQTPKRSETLSLVQDPDGVDYVIHNSLLFSVPMFDLDKQLPVTRACYEMCKEQLE